MVAITARCLASGGTECLLLGDFFISVLFAVFTIMFSIQPRHSFPLSFSCALVPRHFKSIIGDGIAKEMEMKAQEV